MQAPWKNLKWRIGFYLDFASFDPDFGMTRDTCFFTGETGGQEGFLSFFENNS
jgi:hypothetical protein